MAEADRDAARAVASWRRLSGASPLSSRVTLELMRARIHAVLEEREAAIRLVRRAYSEGAGSDGWHRVHTTRDFEALRRDDAFRRLVGPRDP